MMMICTLRTRENLRQQKQANFKGCEATEIYTRRYNELILLTILLVENL